LFSKYTLVRLYTDKVPPKYEPTTSAEYNKDELLYGRFKAQQLPLYVILRPDGAEGEEVARYWEGKINDVNGFMEFLKKPLESNRLASQLGRK
jgi:hypothetical protein